MVNPALSPSQSTWFPLTRWFFVTLAQKSQGMFWTIGTAVNYSRTLIPCLLKGRVSFKHLFGQTAFIGVDALGIALVMTTFAGMVIALQISKEMVKQGAGNYVGALVAMATLRELAPIMTAVAVISMVGSAYAAELSTMQITKQIDAMRTLHVSPLRYLVLPRLLAGIVALPLMTVITTISGILGGMVVSNLLADIHPGVYLDSVWQQVEYKDVFSTLTKSVVFGYLIVVLSATIGLNTKGGAKEVGTATTQAVVWSFLAIAVFDYILTYLFYGSM
ncbi:MAG: ABC transporter permease [Vampirovibrio sp.]|nr:ABC transporter permease [Vampirovibrio sp.]